MAVALAGIVAGAACLTIEERAEVCRAAMRVGACDFVVNTVDEALRVLKNEVRQRKPISVGLELGTEDALRELRERGVLPQLFVDPSGRYQALGPEGLGDAKGMIAERSWKVRSFRFESSAALRAFDVRLQGSIPVEDLRHRWCVSAPRLFARERVRHVFLTDEEYAGLSGE